MDETLMHTVHHFEDNNIQCNDVNKDYQYLLPIKNQHDTKCNRLCINLRPFVREVLIELKKWYRIVIFTASVSNYADTILDFIDPNNEIFESRYYRNHCCVTNERVHVKDMRLFEQPNSNNDANWNLKDIVIVDNASHSFAYHINNGYPILPFYNDKQDKELIHMYYFLKKLATFDDVRPVIANTFFLEKLLVDNICELIEGIIEYSVQEMTDEDMLLFDKYFAEQTNQNSEPIYEEEQGQSIEPLSCENPGNLVNQITDNSNDANKTNNHDTDINIINFQSIIQNQNLTEKIHNEKQVDYSQETYPKYSHNNRKGTVNRNKLNESSRKSKISQKLEEYRKRYL